MATLCTVPSVGRPRSSTMPWPSSTLRCGLAADLSAAGAEDSGPVLSFLSEQAVLRSKAANTMASATLIDRRMGVPPGECFDRRQENESFAGPSWGSGPHYHRYCRISERSDLLAPVGREIRANCAAVDR